MLLPPGMRKNVGLLASRNLATSSRKPLALDSQSLVPSLAKYIAVHTSPYTSVETIPPIQCLGSSH